MKNKGYTLIELALVFSIGGVMLASTGSMMLVYTNKAKMTETTTRIERINTALRQYVKNNSKYPCPASMTAGVEASEFGYEASADCTAGALSGTWESSGRAGIAVRVGALPTRSLNLPDEDMFDGWGNRLVYAVTENLATFGSFVQDGGAIYIIDSNGNNAQVPAGTAHYVLLSLGPDGLGAYGFNGAVFRSCPGAAYLQKENCDQNATFRTTLKSATTTDTASFDDVITYGAQFDTAVQVATMPQYAVAAFDLNACPSGWSDLASAVGRTLVGVGSFSESVNTGTRPAWSFSQTYNLNDTGGYANYALSVAQLPSHTHDQRAQGNTVRNGTGAAYTLGYSTSGSFFTEYTGGSTAFENRQPYVALRYCIKN